MSKNLIYGSLALLVVAMVVSVGTASAHLGGWFGGNEEIKQALENKDFDAWKEAVSEKSDSRISSITQDDFDRMVERYEANAEKRAEWEEKMAPVKEAIENRDYEAWRTAVEDLEWKRGKLDIINEDNFDTYVDMHEAKQNGDYEKARELAEELGLPMKGHHGKHKWGGCTGGGEKTFNPDAQPRLANV